MLNYPELTPRTIDSFRQNSPELVIRDMRDYLNLNENELDLVRKILMARGINKWLKVRRDIIAYKKQIRNQIKEIEKIRQTMPKTRETYLQRKILLEQSKTLQHVRCMLKNLCMTDRWQVWPKDKHIEEGMKMMNTLRARDINEKIT